MGRFIGQDVPRVEGPEKVTGSARYSGEITLPDLAHAQIVGARVASGRITSIDTTEAERADGVAGILTYHNTPKVNQVPLVPSLLGGPAPGQTFFPMQDDVIHYAGQPVAVVVAATWEQAQYAATLIQVSYTESPSVTTIDQGRADAYDAEKIFGGLLPGRTARGDVDAGLAAAQVTSPFDDWAEPAFGVASQLYASPAYEGIHRLVRGNTMTPTFTRGPGEALGVFTLECAMDELAAELGVDPIELRLRNLAETVPGSGHPWSSYGLPECLQRGAERIGWASRNPRPRSERDGNWLIGTGMAAAAYPVAFFMRTQRARAHLYADGTAIVATSTQEFGPGTPTVLTQVAADALGVELLNVRVEFGDTSLPGTGSPVGSNGAMMISAAVHNAGTAVRDQLIAMAVADPASPLHGADPATVTAAGGRLMLSGDPGTGETYATLMSRHRMNDAEAIGSWDPPPLDTPYGLLTFGAQFAKVAVDADLGIIRVRHLAGAFAPGRILNPRTARSQLMGGMLWGMSQALLEGNHMDTARAGWASTSLGEYLVPVNADAPDVDVDLIEVEDHVTGPLGVKGVGEIGQVGCAAAIANAVYHATGYRVRELPIAIEHLLAHLTAARASR